MEYKWIGAALILTGCGGFGWSLGAAQRRQTRDLKSLQRALAVMEEELQYRLTSLPELCRIAAEEGRGTAARFFQALAEELEAYSSPDPAGCMDMVLSRLGASDMGTRRLLKELGYALGRFDLPGQVRGLQYIRQETQRELDKLEAGKEERLRCWQTLSICAGLALAILFL